MPLKLRLIRNDDQTKDDIVIIRKRCNVPGFLVRYTDGLVPNRVWVQDKMHTETLIYLERVLTNMIRDNDPFFSLQVEIPGYPVALYLVSKFTDLSRISLIENVNDFLISPFSDFTE